MKRKREATTGRGITLLALLCVFALVLAACGAATEEQGTGEQEGAPTEQNQTTGERPERMNMVTGGTGGTYYPLGGMIAQIITDETGVETTAQVSDASVENMTLIQDGNADIAFTQTDIADYAVGGKLMFEGNPVENVRAIGTLYSETIQLVTLAGSDIESVEDLAGKSVSVGAPGSGAFANAEQILEVHGLTVDDVNAQYLSFDESVEGIQDGNIDAAFITAGFPTAAVESLSATNPVKIISLTEDKIAALQEAYPYYAPDTIPAGTYGLEEDVQTVAVLAMLVTRAELDQQLIYEVTKALFDNVDKIEHGKAEQISAETALNGVSLELHPGAAQYFEEKGISKEE